MNNAPCTTLSWGEELQIMKAFPQVLSDGEEDIARQFFEQFVFFEAVEKNVRRCICTSCRQSFFVEKEIMPDFFRQTHGKPCECPNCGQRATLLAMGKYRNFNNLDSHQRGIQISCCGDKLLVQAGWIVRTFDDEDLGGTLDFIPWRRYCFAPGVRFMWTKNASSWFGQRWTSEAWARAERIREPFQRRPYEREAAYVPLGVEHLAESSMRYCQYGAWFDDEYGGFVGGLDWDTEPFRIAWFIQYLSEYTRRPQMELLVKLGYQEVIRDLVIRGKQHGDILNWKADSPAAFFRLSKADYRFFVTKELNFSGLKGFYSLKRAGLIRSLQEYAAEREDCGTDFANICRCVKLANVSFERAKNYLRGFENSGGPVQMNNAAQFWVDYLDAAKALRYDLRQDDVRMPKNLRERHDNATAAAKIVADEKKRRAYAARYQQLAEQFEFEDEKLCIRVPRSVQDIVEEGKTLRHCVGGYADRHVRGAVTILFLRKRKNPEASYVTIELTTENNCEKLRIVQIHGFRNEADGKESPRERHREFLDGWLDWVHAGSRRDKAGKPVLPKKKKEVKSA